jgi:hypothetical protein
LKEGERMADKDSDDKSIESGMWNAVTQS